MIDFLARRVAIYLKGQLGDRTRSEQVLFHGFKVFALNHVVLILLLLIGIIMNNLLGILYALSFPLLRWVSGGYHTTDFVIFNKYKIKSADLCFVVSIGMIVALSYVPQFSTLFNLAIGIINLILVSLYAPSQIVRRTRVKEDNHYIFKIISIVLVLASLLFNNSIVLVSMLLQCISLIDIKKRR